jgi:hypothetical protein
MTDEKPYFAHINFIVCMYCKNLVRGKHINGYNEGCGLRKLPNGKYQHLTHGPGLPEEINYFSGCDRFEPSGVPVHPLVLEVLVKTNSLCAKIPVDSNATETSWNFDNKIKTYLPKKSITCWKQIEQNSPQKERILANRRARSESF